jgi:hypothetical protein
MHTRRTRAPVPANGKTFFLLRFDLVMVFLPLLYIYIYELQNNLQVGTAHQKKKKKKFYHTAGIYEAHPLTVRIPLYSTPNGHPQGLKLPIDHFPS